MTPEEQDIYVKIWSKVVDTQMHFNDMSVKSRQFGLGFVAAALGLGIVLLAREQDYSVYVNIYGIGFNLNATVIIITSSAFALYAVKLLDLNVYHKMLRGSVAFGEDFEENYMKQIFSLNKGMTQAISHYSRFEDASIKEINKKYEYLGINKKAAYNKIQKFYWVSISVIIAAASLLFLITADFGHNHSKQSAFPLRTEI